VESILARHTVARAIYVAPVLIAIFWVTRGFDGAWSSAIGVVIVLANFLLAGAILSISARISLTVYHAAALIGFFLRLGLMVLTVLLIAELLPIDRIAFGISAVAAYLVLLSWEAVAVSKGRERDLDWTT
jgi:predicted Na+-dependent transporter